MKKLWFIGIFIMAWGSRAQTGVYNSGNLRIHEGGQLGFHTNLINDGVFDQNLGLAGFYGENQNSISGAFSPRFFDMELLQDNGIFLETSVAVLNNMNFIVGNVFNDLANPATRLDFLQNAFYIGHSDIAKVVGYAGLSNKQNFIFPVGDSNNLRSLGINASGVVTQSQCAYFPENPNAPTSFPEQLNTDRRERDLGEVSEREFWVLTGSTATTVTATWNAQSALVDFALELEDVTLAGWNILLQQWISLGTQSVVGDLTEGFITSEAFIPDNYAAITFAANPLPQDSFIVNNPTLGNYFLSPDGDGTNDFLVIEGLEESPNNTVIIFNRLGQKVFERENYVNEFNGFANVNNLVVNKEAGLPEGVYFYIAILKDLELEYQGFLFLNR
ncbi:MAG: gliding motility-associated C-terminal domain-containing protein [Bacteroidota bacterium]